MSSNERPFDGLEPGVILDAVERFGICCDGRLLALNSFENRVYQIGTDDGTSAVAKFYRPERWNDACILEEHAFSAELTEQEIPVVAPLANSMGQTLAEHAGFRYAVYPSVGGYWPELQTEADRTQLGRFIGRMHAMGSVKAFEHRPEIDIESYGARSAEFLLESGLLPPGLDSNYGQAAQILLERVRERYATVPELGTLRSVTTEIDYGEVEIDGERFSLPTSTVHEMTDWDGALARNETTFHNCRKFSASSDAP